MANNRKTGAGYDAAREVYAAWGVDTEKALAALAKVAISLQCWQGDDVAGFEKPDAGLSGGGLQVTGDFPGRARTPGELRADLEKAFSLIPGSHRLNLHAMYGEFGGKVDRDEIEPKHFQGWIDWARGQGLKLDFNATLFSHPMADSGFTLSSLNANVRDFWIEHVRRCRAVSALMGRELGSPCIHNLWIPDGSKDTPADRLTHRRLLKESLDAIYVTRHDPGEMKDAVESKLFGIGSESFVVGSHEFYLEYAAFVNAKAVAFAAARNDLMVCLDTGHYHPTESVADKISAILPFADELLLHVSRGVRWDSDHVVALTDDLRALMQEIVRCNALDRVHIALDFFDASINRVGAWVIGARATLKALLLALLEPREMLVDSERAGDLFTRLAVMEESKTLPFGTVWDEHCLRQGVLCGSEWMEAVRRYGDEVLCKRT